MKAVGSDRGRFTAGSYFRILTRMLGEPRRFFSDWAQRSGPSGAWAFLGISGLVFTAGSLMTQPEGNLLLKGGILMANAFGMVLVAAGIGYGIVVLTMGKRTAFGPMAEIYALAAGVTLLASWLPFFVWLTEPWKWWLIGTGLVRGLGFGRRQALMVIGLSIGLIILGFWSVLGLTVSGRG